MAEKDTRRNADLAEQEAQALRKGRDIRQEHSKVIDELLKKQQKLNDLEQDSIANKEEIVKLQISIEASLKKAQILEDKSRKNQEEIQKIREEETERLDKAEKVEKRLSDLRKETNIELSQSSKLMAQISENSSKFSAETSGANKLLEQTGNILRQAESISKSQSFLTSDFVESLESGRSISSDIVSIEQEIVSQIDKASIGQYESINLSKQREAVERLRFEINDENSQMTEKEREQALELVKQQMASLDTLEMQNIQLKKMSEQSAQTLGVFNKFAELDIKGGISQYFQLDKLKSDMKEKLGKTIVDVTESVRGGNGLSGAFKAAGSNLGQLGKAASKLALGLGIGALIGLGGFLVHTFFEADKEIAELGKNFGISKDEAKELHHTAVDVSDELRITGINSEQVAKSLKTASENLGGLDLTGQFNSGNEAVKQMVKDTAVLTEKFGLSGEEAGKMNNIAAIAGKSVGEMSMMASKLGNGIFTAKESLKILADIPPSVVSSMSKMPEAMIKTAQKAKLLGVSMKQIQDIGRKTLDIESSLEAQMEAQVLLGRNINLDKMRAAALDGDQETVMNEVLNVAGSLEDFNKMNVIQKEALAKATGMEVDELAKMLGKQEELNKAGLSQTELQKLQAKNAGDLATLAAGTNDANKKAYLEKLAAEKKSEETQAAMADLMKRLQELAVKLVTPIMDVVDGLMNGEEGASAMGGVLNLVSGTIKAIVPGIKMIASLIGFLIKPLTFVLGLFSGTEETTHEVADAAGKVAGGVEEVNNKVTPLLSGFGSLLGIVTAIGGLFAGKAIIGKGMDMLKDKAGDLGKSLVSKVGGPLGKIGGKLLGGGGSEKAASLGGLGGDSAAVGEAEKGKNMVSGILDKMKEIIDSIKGVVQSAIGFVKDVGKDLLSTLNDLIKGIGDILKTGAEIVVNVGTQLAEGAMKILNIIMDGLASAAKRLPDIMKALGEAVVAFFKPMQSLVNPAIIIGIAVFTAAMIGLGYAFKLLGEGLGAAAPGITAFFDGVGGVIETVGEAIAGVIETITTSVLRLQEIDGGKMLSAATGITAIAASLALFGGGSAIAGIGSALGEFFGGDPVEKFNRFASIDATQLNAVATAINLLAQAMKTFSSAIDQVNFDKVDEMVSKLEDLKDAQVSGAVSDLATTGISAVTGFLGNVFGGSSKEETASPVTATSGGGTSMAKVEQKLDTLIGLFSQVATQPTVIKFGDKTVEEIKNQLNFKKSYNVGVDNTYGRTI